MARTKDLAGLAALGALGYMLTKGKDQTTDQTPGLGRQSLGAGYDSPGTNTGAAQTGIADADTNQSALKAIQSTPVSTPEAPNPMAGNQGVLSSKPSATTGAATKSKGTSLPSGIMGGARQADAVGLPSGIMGGSRQPDSTTPTQTTGKRETYKGLDGKIHLKDAKPQSPLSSMRNPRTGREMSTFKKGGVVKMASGGVTSSASRRADGIATKGKTRGKIC